MMTSLPTLPDVAYSFFHVSFYASILAFLALSAPLLPTLLVEPLPSLSLPASLLSSFSGALSASHPNGHFIFYLPLICVAACMSMPRCMFAATIPSACHFCLSLNLPASLYHCLPLCLTSSLPYCLYGYFSVCLPFYASLPFFLPACLSD
jgi:hypothetical protein